MSCAWKTNWDETTRHFLSWWNGEGPVMTIGGAPPADPPHEEVREPETAPLMQRYTDPVWRARNNHYHLAACTYPADNLPIAGTDIGPGSLALLLGCEPGFSPDTVWFQPAFQNEPEPESLPPLRFDPDNRWWRIHEATLKECAVRAAGKYVVGCPDLIENVDILSALRDPQTLMFDMVERPGWVHEKIDEINQAFFEAYQRVYDIIRLPDGSSVFGAFALWGPGKTAKVQCDAAAMISPGMFEEFVVPALTEQCRWLDHSLFHLDGTQCIVHLDALLAIEELHAIQWTPQAGIDGGGHPRWYALYRRILDAGKSVQAVGVQPHEVAPLLKATGGRGMYIMTYATDQEQLQTLETLAGQYR